VLEVLVQHHREVTWPCDQEVVEAFAAQGADEASAPCAGVCARCPDWGAEDADVGTPDAFTGGWNGPAAALSAVEAVLAVGASVWLLGAAQRHLARPAGPLTRALCRASYAAFVLQGPVLIGLALALRPFPASAGAKAITVGLIGVLLSFGLGTLVLRWTPLRRVL